MSTKERDFVVVRRINSFDTAAVLELISQIPLQKILSSLRVHSSLDNLKTHITRKQDSSPPSKA